MEKPATSQGNPLGITEIYENLFDFINDVLFRFELSTDESGENKITQNIEFVLNKEAHDQNTFFVFQNQYEEGNRTTDIGVLLKDEGTCFCWIEAKRLPTPNGNRDRDEREYVFVNKEKFRGNGGIHRFKEGKHAQNLLYSIMFGYIQKNDTDYWLEKINAWITELAKIDSKFWCNEDCLEKFISNKCDIFLSTHKRKDKTTIELHHYWIKL